MRFVSCDRRPSYIVLAPISDQYDLYRVIVIALFDMIRFSLHAERNQNELGSPVSSNVPERRLKKRGLGWKCRL